MNHSKITWSPKTVKRFIEMLEKEGREYEIWQSRDSLNNCTIYTIKWN